MRILLDTNILVRANPLASGPARRLLLSIFQGNHTLVTSAPLLQELERVLAYPRVRKRWDLKEEEVRQYIQGLVARSTLVEPASLDQSVIGDPDDEPVLATALAGKADIVCTLDAHFFQPRVVAFCDSHGIRVLKDPQLAGDLAGDLD